MEQALSDVKVLDLTWYIAGSYCTKLLADYGADVIKVEKPGEGDPARRMEPFLNDEPHPEKSGLFLHLNTNKRGITLNLKSKAGKRIFKQLVEDVDILVESFRPGVMARLGLDYETLEGINPKLVMTSISNFGQTGPYRDFKASEIILYGMGGPMHFTGLPDREPLKLGGTVIQFQVGNVAAIATVMALYGGEIRGTGEHVDVSAMETLLGSMDRRAPDLVGYQYTGEVGPRTWAVPKSYPWGIYPCKDGYFELVGGGPFFFPRSARMLGMPELVTDPRFSSVIDMINPERKEEFESQYFYPWILERTKGEALEAAQKEAVPSAPVNNIEELVGDPHFQQRGFWVEVDHPMTGKVKYPGAPYRMSETPWQIRRAAPLLGEHNKAVYSKLGYTKDDLVKLRERGVI